jgi:hypothetical protein
LAFSVAINVPEDRGVQLMIPEEGRFRFRIAERAHDYLVTVQPLEIRLKPMGRCGSETPGSDAGFKLFVVEKDLCVVCMEQEGQHWRLVSLLTAEARKATNEMTTYVEEWSLGLTRPDGTFETFWPS